MAVLYPLFLGSYWSVGASGASVTARLAWITAGANLVVSILAPIFGTIADAGGYRKRFLVGLALIGAIVASDLPLGLPPFMGPPKTFLPTGVIVGTDGVIYVTADVSHTVLKLTPVAN